MAVNFQFEVVSTILLLRDCQGNVIKESRKLPESFYYMEFLGNNTYYDRRLNMIWHKKTSSIVHKDTFYIQEEYTDITELWYQKQELLNDLETDVLTQTSNFRAVQKKKEEIIKAGKSCILVMCDMNSFKYINDVYGHVMGDNCLIEVAKIFNNYIGENDMVARVGGDEFLFIFDTSNTEYVKQIMKVMQSEVIELGQKMQLPLSICMGFSVFESGNDWDKTRENADLYSYQNKMLTKKKEIRNNKNKTEA